MHKFFFFLVVIIMQIWTTNGQNRPVLNELKNYEIEEGCYCLYGLSKARLEAEKIVMIVQGPYARLSINNKLNSLNNGTWETFLEKYENENGIYPYLIQFMNSNYEVSINTKKLFEEEGGEFRNGSLTIRDKRSGLSSKYAIYGSCWCE